MSKFFDWLQFFADGGASGGDGGGDGAGTGAVAAGDVAAAGDAGQQMAQRLGIPRDKRGRFAAAMKKAGLNPEQQTETGEGGQTTADGGDFDVEAAWNRPEIQERVNAAMRERGKKATEERKAAKKMKDELYELQDAVGKSVGVKRGEDGEYDIAALTKAFVESPAAFEDAALNEGKTVDDIRNSLTEEMEDHRANRKHLAGLEEQAEALKQKFPGFDLDEAMKNPRFVRASSRASGLSLEEAYFALHGGEIVGSLAAAAGQQAEQVAARTRASNAGRPRENGQGASAAAKQPRSYEDYMEMMKNMTPEQRRAFVKRL